MERELRRFRVTTTGGQQHTIVEYGTIVTSKPLTGGALERIGGKRLALSDGRDVNWIDAETFEIVATDEIVRRISK